MSFAYSARMGTVLGAMTDREILDALDHANPPALIAANEFVFVG